MSGRLVALFSTLSESTLPRTFPPIRILAVGPFWNHVCQPIEELVLRMDLIYQYLSHEILPAAPVITDGNCPAENYGHMMVSFAVVPSIGPLFQAVQTRDASLSAEKSCEIRAGCKADLVDRKREITHYYHYPSLPRSTARFSRLPPTRISTSLITNPLKICLHPICTSRGAFRSRAFPDEERRTY